VGQNLFDNDRYITQAASLEIPPELQALMWEMIDERKKQRKKLDYLQVFNLEVGAGGMQSLTHSQEVPAFKFELLLSGVVPPVTEKIYVIDDGDHSTMMLAADY